MEENLRLILESLALLLETEAERRTAELKEHRHPIVVQHNESIRSNAESKLLAIEALLNLSEDENQMELSMEETNEGGNEESYQGESETNQRQDKDTE